MKTLKFKTAFFSLMAVMALSVLMISCEQTVLTDAEEISQHPIPVQYVVDNDIDLEDYQDDLTFDEIINYDDVSYRCSCPSFNHASSQLSSLSSCGSSHYCKYLKLFWRIHVSIARVDCCPTTWCRRCSDFIALANSGLAHLENIGAHSSYISSIEQQINILESVCSGC